MSVKRKEWPLRVLFPGGSGLRGLGVWLKLSGILSAAQGNDGCLLFALVPIAMVPSIRFSSDFFKMV